MRYRLIFLFALFAFTCYSQQELKLTQVFNNQLLINPAYAGTRNSLSTNIFAKKQWLGLNGAPTTYGVSVHSPINRSMANIGGIIRNDQYGPINLYNVKAIYSYLLKLNGQTFLSFGMNVGLSTFNLNATSLTKFDLDDPEFAYNLSNKFKPNFGAGVFLYKQWMYLGISCPFIFESKLSSSADEIKVNNKTYRDIYLAAGVVLPLNDKFKIKPNCLFTYRSDNLWYFDTNLQFILTKSFWLSVLYRYETRYALAAHIQMGKTIGIDYSYDIPVHTISGNPGGHEIGITIDYMGVFRKSRKRRFDRKKKKDTDYKPGIPSISIFLSNYKNIKSPVISGGAFLFSMLLI